jgi:hypothetical protein
MKVRIGIWGTPFNGLGQSPNTENPAQGLRQAKLVPLLESTGHSVTDFGDLSGFQFQEIRDPETGIKDLDLWVELSNSLSPMATLKSPTCGRVKIPRRQQKISY